MRLHYASGAGKYISIDGKARMAQDQVDDILNTFQAWDTDKNYDRVTFTLATKESSELCKLLIRTFQLNKLPFYEDISSLKDARWALTHGYSKEKGYPLWVLKYVDGIIPEMIPLVEKLFLVVTDPNINKNTTLMGETIDLLKQYDYDLRTLLKTDNIFEDGYHNFLHSQDIVKIEDSEIDDAKDYIKSHLQSEVGSWKENEVLDKLKDWRLQLIQKQEPSLNIPISPIVSSDNIETTNRFSSETPNPYSIPRTNVDTNSSRFSQAIDNINGIQDLHQAQSLLRDICEVAGDEILDLIIEY